MSLGLRMMHVVVVRLLQKMMKRVDGRADEDKKDDEEEYGLGIARFECMFRAACMELDFGPG